MPTKTLVEELIADAKMPLVFRDSIPFPFYALERKPYSMATRPQPTRRAAVAAHRDLNTSDIRKLQRIPVSANGTM